MTNLSLGADSVIWNLGDLYSSPNDPDIARDLEKVAKRASSFQERYRSRIASSTLDAPTLFAAIQEYEQISQELAKPGAYASLRFAADAADAERGAFLQSIRERSTQVWVLLTFFDLELNKIEETLISSLKLDPQLAPYIHFLDNVRLFQNHVLSETEEVLLQQIENTGSRAFKRLFDQMSATTSYRVGDSDLTQSEVVSLAYSPDRNIRLEAAAALTVGLRSNAQSVAFIFNTLLQDKAIKDKLRQYRTPEEARHLSNELEPIVVETVVGTCIEHYRIVSDYYNLKREILGLRELTHIDRHSALFQGDEKIEWPTARALVLDSFADFSPLVADCAKEFFDRNWIDAQPRKGKRGGAFCSSITPDLHPYVFLSYLGKGRDVMTLAHEMGHGIHGSLARRQSYLNFHGTLPMAEVASTFSELLVFERINQVASDNQRLALAGSRIEDSFATIFRQASLYRFEQSIHAHRRAKGELMLTDFCEYWMTANQEMYGNSLKLGEEYEIWWSYISHFVGSPFYVYAYCFGEMLALSLYHRYKSEGDAFAARYIEMLASGGSLGPGKLLAMVGVDIADPEFWKGGMAILASEVQQFSLLWNHVKASGAGPLLRLDLQQDVE